MEKFEFTANEKHNMLRLDKVISAELPDMTRSAIQRIIENGNINVNGKTAGKSLKIKQGDLIEISLPAPEALDIEAQNIALDIVFEDGDLLVVNKPRGMVVHPAPGHYDGTLVNALLFHCGESLSGINGVARPGIVHRIDKDTSGLLIVAKNDFAHNILAKQISEHSFKREYFAVLCGNLKNNKGIIERPLGRNPNDRKKQAINGIKPRDALTKYELIENFKRFCFVKCILETGRTHQIRVHMQSIGHPLAGDTVYGGAKNTSSLSGQCLHAATIGFVHPRSGEYMEFHSELPDWFRDFLDKARNE